MLKTAGKDQASQLNGMSQNGRSGDMEISPSSSESIFSFNSSIVPEDATQELENIADFVSQNTMSFQLNQQQLQNGLLPELNHSISLSNTDFMCPTDLEPISINSNNFIPTTFDAWLTNESQNHPFSELAQSHDTSLVSYNKLNSSGINNSHGEDFTSVLEDQDRNLDKTQQNYPESIQERYNFRSYEMDNGKDTSLCSYPASMQSFTFNDGEMYSSMSTTGTPCTDSLFTNRANDVYPQSLYGNKSYSLSRCLSEVGSEPKSQDFLNTSCVPHVENLLHEEKNPGRGNGTHNGIGQKGYLSSSSDSRTTSHDTDANETSPNVTSDEAEDKATLSTHAEGRLASKKTLYNEKWGVKVLKAWCTQHNISTTFCDITAEELNELLINFWQTIQKASGGKYGRNSLFNLRAMINKYLKSKPRCLPFDIVTDNRFRSSNECLERELQVLARTGRKIDHKIPISLEHMWKLYESGALGLDTAESLMRKVWFEITLHFNRRGATPQDKLRRNSFKISRDKNGRFLERAVSMETDSRQSPDRMYETGGRLCPILSYERYLEKLHPQQQRLFQQPRKKAQKQGEVWFGKAPIGEKALQSMMGTISMAANLPIKYTNHCVRTTPAAQLTEMMKRVASGLDATRSDKKGVDSSNDFFCNPPNPPPVSHPTQQANLYIQKYPQQHRVSQSVPSMSGYYPNSVNRTWSSAGNAIQTEEQSYYMGLQRYFEPIGQDDRTNSSQLADNGFAMRNYASTMPPPTASMNESYNSCGWTPEPSLGCEQDGNHLTAFTHHQKYTPETQVKHENGYLDISGINSPLSNAPVLNQIVASQDFLKPGLLDGEHVSRENSFAEGSGFKLPSLGSSPVTTEYTQSIDSNSKSTSMKKINAKLLGVST